MIAVFAIWTVFIFPVQESVYPAETDTIPRAVFPDSLIARILPERFFEPGLPDSVSLDHYYAQRERRREEADQVRIDTVHVWNYQFPEGFEVGETDSTLRWTHLLNLFDRFHQKKGAITNRTGTVGRMDGLDLHAFESRHLNLEMEGLGLNDPLTGAVNWNRLPIHKLSDFREVDMGASYRSQARLRDHYLTKPRTYLNFDESKFNYRSLEFAFTQNIRQTTNIELSFWDRRDGGGYTRQGVEGRQGLVRVVHQLNDRWLMKAAYINNAMDREESFGYEFPQDNPLLFPFNRFIATTRHQGSASSNQTSSDMYLQAHHRRGTSEDVSSEFGLHYQTDKWSLTYNADTLATNFQKMELFARQHMGLGSTQLTGTGRMFFLNEAEGQNLATNRWLGGQADLDISQFVTNRIRLTGYARTTMWNDGRRSAELSGQLRLNPFSDVTFAVFAGLLSRAPDIQASYWLSNEFSGNSDLENELSVTAGGMAEIGLGRYFTLGARADIRNTEHGLFVESMSENEWNFMNIEPYTQISGTGWLRLDSRIFEGEVSATWKTFNTDVSLPDPDISMPGSDDIAEEQHSVNTLMNVSGDRMWLKSHLYWKNYLFEQATYVKAGFSGVFSPNAFRTAEFFPQINRWQHGTNEYINPSFYRLDLDVSARIRWFMVLIKWENIFDRAGQLGYFETTGYPMPERRFIFGIRVLFTN